MDILSDVLQAVRLSGAIFFDVDAYAPWVSEAPAAQRVASLVMPGAQHVIEYHVVTDGCCWGAVVGAEGEPIRLGPGSVIVFPQGDPHVLSSAPGMRGTPDMRPFKGGDGEHLPFHLEHHGGGSDRVGLICGFLGCDALPFNPLLQALPRCIHIADAYMAEDGWLKTLISATVKESRGRRVGGSSMLSRLSEMIFVEVLRRYMETLPSDTVGWFKALADPQIGHAIELMHADAKRAWTLADLAREVGVSRTVLIERFNAYLGVAPMTYLSNWRMQMAASLLAGGAVSISRVAVDVGYDSEAAFSRAFKRFTGMPPARWRAHAASMSTP
jgi:AraC-like DNA-binding protein